MTAAGRASANMTSEFDASNYPRRLNIGCGWDRRDGYLNVDLNAFHKPDLVADIRDLSMLPSGHYEEILAQDVLEHLPRIATASALREWNRLLCIGGRLHLRVPSLEGLWEMFREKPTFENHVAMMQNLFGTQAYNGDFHYTTFTRVLLEGFLQRTGFQVERLDVLHGWLFDGTGRKIAETAPSVHARTARLLESPDERDFVQQTYRVLLQREPDESGFAFYHSALLMRHLTRQQVIDIIRGSPEYAHLMAGSNDG
jgi:predicted SAM-dependent methyltransferase